MRQSTTIRLDQDILSKAKRVAVSNNRTLTNYIETLIRRDIEDHYPETEPSENLHDLLASYSTGNMTRQTLEEKTGLWFSEVLLELGKHGLPLPRVDSSMHLNRAQLALQHAIFSEAQ
jgi:hypothetical protein